MPEAKISSTPEIARAFAGYQREVTINNVRVGCYLGMALMPAGMVLDLFVYPLGHQFIESWGRVVAEAMLTGCVPIG